MPDATFELNGNIVSVFPNPVSDFLIIDFDQTINSEINIELISATGQLILKNKINAGEKEFKINMDGYSSGIYFLKIIDQEKIVSDRLVKN